MLDEQPKTVDQAHDAMLFRNPCPEQARKLLYIIVAAVWPHLLDAPCLDGAY